MVSKTDLVRVPKQSRRRLRGLSDLNWFPVSASGVFFFTLALFGFASLTILGIFANERLLYMLER